MATGLALLALLAAEPQTPSVAAVCAAIENPPVSMPVGTDIPPADRAEAARLLSAASALVTTRNRDTVTRAIAMLERATMLDPLNAAAFAKLGNVHGLSPRFADAPQAEAEARQWQAVSRAYALAPDELSVLLALANVVVVKDRDLACAERLLIRVRQKDPHNADAAFGLSSLRGSRGDFTTAYSDLESAIVDADPAQRLNFRYGAGRLYLMARDYRRVIDHYATLIALNPGSDRNWLAYFYRALAYSALAEPGQALAEARKMQVGPDGDAGALANLARMQVLGGEREAGLSNLQLLLDRDARGERVVAYQIAAVYEALRDRDAAFRWLMRYAREVDGLASWILWPARDARWDSLRSDPRFEAFLKAAAPAG